MRAFHAESSAHGCGYADCGRAADDHVFDGFCDVAIVRVGVVDHFARKAELIEDYDAFGRPADWFDCVQAVVLLSVMGAVWYGTQHSILADSAMRYLVGA